ncbi:hypothetical protein GGF31_004920 [Allomyces arbusculus]|nr:hypothetical protein GGF31_004920 [Allomyces arbusculus]
MTSTTTAPMPKRSRPRAVRLVTILILLVAVLAVLGTVPLARAQDVDTDVAQDVDLAPELDAQAATGDQCAARCAMEDTNCIARCHGVPSGGNDVALNTGRCVSNCQVAHPVDPAAQSACFSRCQAAFVDPAQSSVPPAPTPEPAPTTTANTTPSPSTPSSEPTVTATPGTAQESTSTSTTAPAPPATPTSSASEPVSTGTGTATTGTGTATTTTTRSATNGIMTSKAIPKTMATPPVDSNAQAAVLVHGAPFAAAVAAAVAGML